jgi:hypothetical protein
MSEAKTTSEARTRLTLDLSARLNAAVENYAETHGVSKAEVLRNALTFLLKAERAAEEGMTVGAWKDDPVNNRRVERDLGIGTISGNI